MGNDWERKQREKLVAQQKERIAAIQKEIETEFPMSQINKKRRLKNIILIAAAAENNALGLENDLPWHLPDDFKRFKALTSGHSIIMGRKTFETFPKLLPNRKHLIVTRNAAYTPKFEAEVFTSIEDALAATATEETVYIIGGGEIYTLALPLATHIELTRIHATIAADTFFPEFSMDDWELVASEHHSIDEKHKHSFTFQTFKRKS